MSIPCDVIIGWNATPQQLATLGDDLWRWCSRSVGKAEMYQYLDSQALADLVAGRLPVSSQPPLHTDGQGVHFRVRDGVSPDRRATLEGLRGYLRSGAIQDILVDGTSWHDEGSAGQTGRTLVSMGHRSAP